MKQARTLTWRWWLRRGIRWRFPIFAGVWRRAACCWCSSTAASAEFAHRRIESIWTFVRSSYEAPCSSRAPPAPIPLIPDLWVRSRMGMRNREIDVLTGWWSWSMRVNGKMESILELSVGDVTQLMSVGTINRFQRFKFSLMFPTDSLKRLIECHV